MFILALSCQAAKLPSLEIEVNATDHQYQSISWKKYNSLNVINDYMGNLSYVYDFVTLEEIGRSFENRTMITQPTDITESRDAIASNYT